MDAEAFIDNCDIPEFPQPTELTDWEFLGIERVGD